MINKDISFIALLISKHETYKGTIYIMPLNCVWVKSSKVRTLVWLSMLPSRTQTPKRLSHTLSAMDESLIQPRCLRTLWMRTPLCFIDITCSFDRRNSRSNNTYEGKEQGVCQASNHPLHISWMHVRPQRSTSRATVLLSAPMDYIGVTTTTPKCLSPNILHNTSTSFPWNVSHTFREPESLFSLIRDDLARDMLQLKTYPPRSSVETSHTVPYRTPCFQRSDSILVQLAVVEWERRSIAEF